MTPTLEFRYLDCIVRVFRKLPPESRCWLLARLRAERCDGERATKPEPVKPDPVVKQVH